MAESLTPIEEDLWTLALACTNSASGASRVVASLARDHRDLGRVSEARLRREVLTRSQLWASRTESSAADRVSPALDGLDPRERAAFWLDGGAGLSVAEIAWVCACDAPSVRSMLEEVQARTGDAGQHAAAGLRSVLAEVDRSELFERLSEARERVRRRERRSALLLAGSIGVFVVIMAVVLLDLLSWRDASETLPGRVVAPSAVDPQP